MGCLRRDGGVNCGTGTIDMKGRRVPGSSPKSHWPPVLLRLAKKVQGAIG